MTSFCNTNIVSSCENYNYKLSVFWELYVVIVGSLYVINACKFHCEVLMLFSCRFGSGFS